jgi:hypothetical protein
VDPAISTDKFMLMAIWGVNGFHLLDLMPAQCIFNTQYFVQYVMAPTVQTIFPQGRTAYTPRLNIHVDNCRYHLSKVTEQFSSRISCCMFPTDLAVPTWRRRISGYSGVSRLDSLAEASPSPKNDSPSLALPQKYIDPLCDGSPHGKTKESGSQGGSHLLRGSVDSYPKYRKQGGWNRTHIICCCLTDDLAHFEAGDDQSPIGRFC